MKIRVGILTAPSVECYKTDGGYRVKDVRIGIGFHWDRREDQLFEGDIEIIRNGDGTQTVVNIIDLEKYVSSVISSEMSSSAPLELLKCHAVIARSWVMRAIGHTDHVLFDVCADDHCQRYEGVGRRTERSIRATEETTGEVLCYKADGDKDVICDCRYHKCCGGRTDVFSVAWEDIDIPYLQSVQCPFCQKASRMRGFMRNLNDFDRMTTDFYSWEKVYSMKKLRSIVKDKSGIDFGDDMEIIPLERGQSGRIKKIKLLGADVESFFEKELTIRKLLSESCLYSSWFDIIRDGDIIHLLGHGWGHGVGLCQIGACQMAIEGYGYKDILGFYYPKTFVASVSSVM